MANVFAYIECTQQAPSLMLSPSQSLHVCVSIACDVVVIMPFALHLHSAPFVSFSFIFTAFCAIINIIIAHRMSRGKVSNYRAHSEYIVEKNLCVTFIIAAE